MSPPILQPFVFIVALLSTCIAIAEDSPPISAEDEATTFFDSDDCLPGRHTAGDSKETIPSWLRPGELAFVRAEEGQAVPLNSIIVVPLRSDDVEALLIIEFSRGDLNEAFVQAFFFDRQALIPTIHPYAQIGVEYLLTEERLILKIHPDVVFHLRDDAVRLGFRMPDEPEYRSRMFTNRDVKDIFRSDDAIGKVILVSGEVHVSTDTEFAKSNLEDVYTQVIGYSMIPIGCLLSQSGAVATKSWWMNSYPPRVLQGR